MTWRRCSPTCKTATCSSSTKSIDCRAAVEEMLYPAMEDRRLDVMIGRGPSARAIRARPAKLTLVGATTPHGPRRRALRDRFGFVGQLDLYDPEDLTVIVSRSAGLLDVTLKGQAAADHRRAQRGTRASRTGC